MVDTIFNVTMFILLILLALAIWAWVYSNNLRKEKSNELRVQHKLDEIFVSPSGSDVVGFRFNDDKLLLGNLLNATLYSFSEISSVDVFRDGEVLNRTNRGSQIAGVAVGGAIFGLAGAIIGGVTGSSKSSTLVKAIGLKIVVDDQAKPNHTVTFFRAPKSAGVRTTDFLLVEAVKKMERAHAHLVNAMRKVSQQAVIPVEIITGNADGAGNDKLSGEVTKGDALDQLERLARLRDSGVVTEAEFQAKKQQILGL